LEVADFIKNIVEDTPVLTASSTDALKAMQLVFKIYENDASFIETGNALWRDSKTSPGAQTGTET
jgi:hypothetical protein